MKELKDELKFLASKLRLKDISEAKLFPKYFEIETIRACNANCKMCTIHDWKDKNNRMSDKLFSKFVKEVAKYKDWINVICLARNGEPLLDKDLPKRISMLKKVGIKYVTFSTNASLLDERKSISLIEAGLDDIMFSIDGIHKETFEHIRKGLNFERVRDNCLRFIKLRNERGKKPSIRIRMVLQDKNKKEEKEWKEFWLSKVSEQDTVYSKQMHSWGNQLPEYEGNIELESKKYSKIPCISPWSTVVIHFNGSIPICACDYNNKMVMGDINMSSIKKIWESENFEKIRNLHASGKRNKIPLCIGCKIWDLDIKNVHKK